MKLDMRAQKFIKKWLKIPSHGVTNLSIFHPYLLNIKTPSEIYKAGHLSNYLSSKMKGDPTVQVALNSQLDRESQWKKKSSTVCESDRIINKAVSEGSIFIPSEDNCQDLQSSIRKNLPTNKAHLRKTLAEETLDYWNSKLQDLTVQGEFLKLLNEEKTAVTWQSIIYNIPKGVMSFAARAATNSLATPDNLKRWGKTVSAKCPRCQNTHCTLHHILNNCQNMLERYTWRHSSVLQYMVKTLSEFNNPETKVYADIPGWLINNSTIPQNIITTLQRPDLVILEENKKTVSLLELACCFEREQNFTNANNRKQERYSALTTDIENRGYTVNLVPFEIGSRGLIKIQTKSDLLLCLKTQHSFKIGNNFFKEISKIALLCSFAIYHSGQDPVWVSLPLLTP